MKRATRNRILASPQMAVPEALDIVRISLRILFFARFLAVTGEGHGCSSHVMERVSRTGRSAMVAGRACRAGRRDRAYAS